MFDRTWIRLSLVLWMALLGAMPSRAPAAALRIVAAENFYGDVARQLAGPEAHIVSVLTNPAADPHLFEPDASTARAIATADLIIYNGAGYDPWMPRLLSSEPRIARQAIEVATLLHAPAGIANPHLWYDPASMPALARLLTARLQRLDAPHGANYARRLQQFLSSLQPIDARIARLRQRYAGTPITATEPIADELTRAMGLQMRNQPFQLAIMNDTEPGARETAAFERSLTSHAVRVLIYNQQATGGSVQRLLAIARQAGVPVVAITETEPPALDYQHWMLRVIAQLERALGPSRP